MADEIMTCINCQAYWAIPGMAHDENDKVLQYCKECEAKGFRPLVEIKVTEPTLAKLETENEPLKQVGILDAIDAQKYLDKFKTELIVVPISKLVANDWNPNQHSEQTKMTLVNSIKKFGFTDPISVRVVFQTTNPDDQEYDIIDGEHRWLACKELGFTKVAVINYGEVKKEEAMTLTQLLNLRGNDDVLKKAKLQKELKALGVSQGSLFDSLPGSLKDKEETIKLLDFDFSQFAPGPDDEEIAKKDDLVAAKKKAVELEIILLRIKSESPNDNLRLAIDQFSTFVRMLKSYLPEK